MANQAAPRDWRPEFWTLVILMAITRTADAAITYIITPDLSRELNPVSSVLGWGWVGLIGVASVVLAGIMWLNYYSLTRPCNNFPAAPDADWSAFLRNYFDGTPGTYCSQHPLHVLAYVTGYAFPRAIIARSVLVVGHNWLGLIDAEWYRPVRTYKLTYLYYFVLPVLAFFWIWVLQRKDFNRYRERT